MKFSKNMMIMCALMAAQTVSLFGAGRAGVGVQSLPVRPTTMTVKRPVGTVAPGVRPSVNVGSSVATLEDFVNKPSSERLANDFILAQQAIDSLEDAAQSNQNIEQLRNRAIGIIGLSPDVIVSKYVPIMVAYLKKPAATRTSQDVNMVVKVHKSFDNALKRQIENDIERLGKSEAGFDTMMQGVEAEELENELSPREVSKVVFDMFTRNLSLLSTADYASWRDNVTRLADNAVSRYPNLKGGVMNAIKNELMKMAKIYTIDVPQELNSIEEAVSLAASMPSSMTQPLLDKSIDRPVELPEEQEGKGLLRTVRPSLI